MTELADTIALTPERERHAGAFLERPHVDQRTERRAHRVVGLVYALHRDGKLPDECFAAHGRFEQDWTTANRTSSAISGYGERIGGHDGSDRGEIRKSMAWGHANSALDALASDEARRAVLMSVTVSPAGGRPYTLEEIGQQCSHFRTKDQARAAGMITLRDALYQLHKHYEPG
jgi:hypothetical protein